MRSKPVALYRVKPNPVRVAETKIGYIEARLEEMADRRADYKPKLRLLERLAELRAISHVA